MQMREDTGTEVLIEGRKVVFSKKGKRIVHGTLVAYQYHGCRCACCRKIHATRIYDYKKRRAAKQGSTIAPSIKAEEYLPYLKRHTDRGVTPKTLSDHTGISYTTMRKIVRHHVDIRPETFEKLKSVTGDLPIGFREDKPRKEYNKLVKDRNKTARQRRVRFNAIFDYFRNGGFTMETLAQRLGTTAINVERFIDSNYDDNRLAMRVCQLHHVLRQGE